MRTAGCHLWRRAPWLAAVIGACLLAGGLVSPSALAAPTPTAIGIQASDVPGYAPVSPTTTSLGSTTLPTALRQCAASDPLLSQFGTGAAATISGLYGQGEGPFGVPALLIGTAVFTDGSATDAQRAFTLLASPSLQSCWLTTYPRVTTAITSGLATLLTSHESAVPSLSLGANVQTTAFAFDETVSALGQTVKDTVQVTVIHVGAVLTLLFTLSTNETFPESVRASVARSIANRMGAKPTTPTSEVAKAKACLHPGIPDATSPLLTTKQVDGVVRAKAKFVGETKETMSVCVWRVSGTTKLRTATRPQSTVWRVGVEGPLASKPDAHAAYLSAAKSASLSVVVPDLGNEAEDLGTSPSPTLIVAAGKYFLEFSSTAPSDATETMVLDRLATLTLARLHLASPVQTPSSGTGSQRKRWSTPHWAGRAFCAAYGQPFLATFRGVAACGEKYVNTTSNLQGATCYPKEPQCRAPGVEFDSTGFQCVELANRYFYFMTGLAMGRRAGAWTDGSDLVTLLYKSYKKSIPGLGVVGLPSGTKNYQPSLHVGDIISMGGGRALARGDTAGHVAVVTKVDVHKHNGAYQGTITMLNQNAQGGITQIAVVDGKMSYGGGYFTAFEWLTGLPTS